MNGSSVIVTGAVVAAALLSIGWLALSRALFRADESWPQVRLFGMYSPLLTWLKYRQLPSVEARPLAWPWARVQWLVAAEVAVIAVWAAWVGRAYLDLDPYMWPAGSEIGIQLNAHYFWTYVQRCGLCALWDGTMNGGMPALANPFAGTLHPLVMITTLIWGVMNGAKVALVICFFIAGAAQWWMARTLGLGRVARLWSALMAVVGGHLSARMATGQFSTILSTVTSSLALAAALHLAVSGRRRSAIVLAVAGALTIISGHGYMQLALISWAPAFLFVVLDPDLKARPIWREYALAVVLSVLLAAVFIAPFAHFLPNFAKDTDAAFSAAQPLEYIPLNLVIRDTKFMLTDTLGKFAAPELFVMYLGWVPALLAFLPLRFARREHNRLLLCLASGVLMNFLMAAAIFLKPLSQWIPLLQGFRHPSLMGLLAAPAVLALAAYGLDGLVGLNWPRVTLSLGAGNSSKTLAFSAVLILLAPLLWSLGTAYEVGKFFIGTVPVHELYQFYRTVASDLNAPGLQWVAPPWGEHALVEPALANGMKLTYVAFPQHWKGREFPDPQVVISRSGEFPGAEVVSALNDIPVYLYEDRAYAYVDLGNRIVPCLATGNGGNLTVKCSTDAKGTLVVQEYSWTGWRAWSNQNEVPLLAGPWLSVEALPGERQYEFRYRPWDVWAGLAITLLTALWCIRLWRRASSDQ